MTVKDFLDSPFGTLPELGNFAYGVAFAVNRTRYADKFVRETSLVNLSASAPYFPFLCNH